MAYRDAPDRIEAAQIRVQASRETLERAVREGQRLQDEAQRCEAERTAARRRLGAAVALIRHFDATLAGVATRTDEWSEDEVSAFREMDAERLRLAELAGLATEAPLDSLESKSAILRRADGGRTTALRDRDEATAELDRLDGEIGQRRSAAVQAQRRIAEARREESEAKAELKDASASVGD